MIPRSVHAAVQRMNFDSKEDQDRFLGELDILFGEPRTWRLVQVHNLGALYTVFVREWTNQTPFQLALQPDTWLKQYFLGLLEPDKDFPEGEVALTTFLEVVAKGLGQEVLGRILVEDFLDALNAEQLQALQVTYLVNVEALCEFLGLSSDLDQTQRDQGVNVLLMLYPSMIQEDSPTLLYEFLKDILPLFVARFAHRFEVDFVLDHTDRLSEWFLLWTRYTCKEEEGLEQEDPYYEMPFSKIVQYVPEYIWWNNGMIYRNNDKQYYFGSAGFRHLALGGSVRKGPDPRPYTRRMARAFVSLPADFPHQDWDLYLYFFAHALGASGLLLELLQGYIRHPEQPQGIPNMMEIWTPVVQKLVAEDFNQLGHVQGRELLSYLYHCLRDQADYQIQGRSLTQLQISSQAFFEQIRNNLVLQQEQRRLRAETYEKHLKERLRSWDPHPRIKTFEERPSGQTLFKIEELTTETALSREGSIMKHCVGTYAQDCKNQGHSIWSLREFKKSKWYSLVTIQVVNNNIVQARGPFNATPTKEHRGIIERWSTKENLSWVEHQYYV